MSKSKKSGSSKAGDDRNYKEPAPRLRVEEEDPAKRERENNKEKDKSSPKE